MRSQLSTPGRKSPWPAAGPLECVAWAAVIVAAVAHGLMRIRCDDVLSHLATARLAWHTGAWPVVNTFSYPHHDFPLYCQYPLFETLIYVAFRLASWEGLSLLLCVGWTGVLLLFARWSGPLRLAAALHLPWMLALLALQRRMMLRPELVSMLLLGCSLFVIDGYLRGRRRLIILLPLIHLLWANAHQLFPISLIVQTLLVLHLWLSRRGRFGIDPEDGRVPLWPALAALLGSLVATLFTPLGLAVVRVTAWTADTLRSHRHHVEEFAYIWDRPLELGLAVPCAILALAALWIGRRRWRPFDVGLLLVSLALVLSTMRGIVFFSVVSIAVFARAIDRNPLPPRLLAQVRPVLWRAARVTLALTTLALAANIIYHRWVSPPMTLRGTQPGLGRTIGDWPDAAIRAVKASPPPGPMMNMPWFVASPLIWYAPEHPTFVDARFETFPRQFLLDAIRSYDDDNLLDQLIREHRPTWIFADHRFPNVRARVARLARGGEWVTTHADTQIVVLVRRLPRSAAYLRDHPPTDLDGEPQDLTTVHAGLRAQQRASYAVLLATLGHSGSSARQLRLARAEAGTDSVALARIELIQRGSVAP